MAGTLGGRVSRGPEGAVGSVARGGVAGNVAAGSVVPGFVPDGALLIGVLAGGCAGALPTVGTTTLDDAPLADPSLDPPDVSVEGVVETSRTSGSSADAVVIASTGTSASPVPWADWFESSVCEGSSEPMIVSRPTGWSPSADCLEGSGAVSTASEDSISLSTCGVIGAVVSVIEKGLVTMRRTANNTGARKQNPAMASRTRTLRNRTASPIWLEERSCVRSAIHVSRLRPVA